MRRYLLIIIALSFLSLTAQVVPSKVLRIVNATTAFGVNLSTGDHVYNIASGLLYIATQGVSSASTLTSASSSFGVHTIPDTWRPIMSVADADNASTSISAQWAYAHEQSSNPHGVSTNEDDDIAIKKDNNIIDGSVFTLDFQSPFTVTTDGASEVNIGWSNSLNYITDGNTNWNNSYSFITDGNTGWNNIYGLLDATHTTSHPIPTTRDSRNQIAGSYQSSGTYNTIIGTDTDISASGSTIVDDVTLTDGVVTAITSRTLTLANLGFTGATNANYITLFSQLTNDENYLQEGDVHGEDVTFLVATADGTLTDEVVVGLTPNGDLGGSWANISVDDDSHNHTTMSLISSSSSNGHYDGILADFSGTTTTGNLVYLSGANTVGQANASSKLPSIGIAINSTGMVMTYGYYTNTSWSFTSGDRIFLSQTGGDITKTQPTGTGVSVQVVGIAIDANTVLFTFDNTIIEL